MNLFKTLLDKAMNLMKRKPASKCTLITLSGAVMLFTPDGNNIVLTPELINDLLPRLPQAAREAAENRV